MTNFWLNRVRLAAVVAASIAAGSCGFHHAKYDNPITKDSQQPDKQLFDRAVKDLEKGRYEEARLTLNTLINTYDSSEYLAKAKLAIADSWFREGGPSSMAQAEAEYKDFELFYPTMPEASESQYKICMIHYDQMDKPDRDSTQVLKAEAECKALVMQYPNSKYVPETLQRLREIDQDLAEGEMRTADFYFKKGSRAAAANRYVGLVQQYPLYSRADEALWKEADAYIGLGQRFRPQAIAAYQEIVRDYPLGSYVEPAKKKLREMEAEVPEPDPKALAHMKYEDENRTKPSLFYKASGFLREAPDVTMAAKSGTPALNPPKQNVPVNVPTTNGAAQPGFTGDVTVAQAPNSAATANPVAALKTTDPNAAASAVTQASANDSTDNGKKNNKKSKKNQKQSQKPDQNAKPAQSQAADQSQTAPSQPQ